MNTKPIPIMITLLASGISCILSLLQEVSFKTFVIRFALTALIFYFLGSVIRVLLDKAFKIDIEETKKAAKEMSDEKTDLTKEEKHPQEMEDSKPTETDNE